MSFRFFDKPKKTDTEVMKHALRRIPKCDDIVGQLSVFDIEAKPDEPSEDIQPKPNYKS